MATATTLIQHIENGVTSMRENGERRLAAGKVDQAKFDQVMGKRRADADRAIAAINELAEQRPESVEAIKELDAEQCSHDVICAMVERLMGRA